MKPAKIPVEFLLKMSRQECGALKSYIQELEYTLKEKDKVIKKQEDKIKDLQKVKRRNSVRVQVDLHLMDMLDVKNRVIPKLSEAKQNKRKVTLYKRAAKAYKAWYDGCKVLITLMDELRHPNKYETPESSSETTT